MKVHEPRSAERNQSQVQRQLLRSAHGCILFSCRPTLDRTRFFLDSPLQPPVLGSLSSSPTVRRSRRRQCDGACGLRRSPAPPRLCSCCGCALRFTVLIRVRSREHCNSIVFLTQYAYIKRHHRRIPHLWYQARFLSTHLSAVGAPVAASCSFTALRACSSLSFECRAIAFGKLD